MAPSMGLSPAKALLLAVQLTSQADLSKLRILVAQTQIPKETLLRVLLSHLTETLNSADYVPFLEDFISGNIKCTSEVDSPIDSSSLNSLGEDEAKRKARKLHLLPLKSPNAPSDIPDDPLVLFLVHRSLRIDEHTGLLAQIPGLLAPFLHHSSYLRTWLISSVLPLLRLNYEYHPGENPAISIPKFESSSERAAVLLLLSKTRSIDQNVADPTIGRDLRGLVGPWMYGERRRKQMGTFSKEDIALLNESTAVHDTNSSWEEVFLWITEKASGSWETAVKVVEQWDGPGDVDTGGFGDGSSQMSDDDQQHLEVRYARSILASTYLITETSLDALAGADRMLSRLASLMDLEKLPSLQQAAALLVPVQLLEVDHLISENATSLRNDLLEDHNLFTMPRESSLQLIHALITSAFLSTRAGSPISIRRAGELVIMQDKADQSAEFHKLVARASENSKQDEKYWTKFRNEVLWLRKWGHERLEGVAGYTKYGRGLFSEVSIELIEKKIFGALLNNSYTPLAKLIYETTSDRPLPDNVLQETILAAALTAYENATNANKTRGSVKKSLDIIRAFSVTLANTPQVRQLNHLIDVTHTMGNYKLSFKQGEPFKPVQLLVHADPLSIIGKILDQNPRSYSRISDLIDIGVGMVRAGLTLKSHAGYSVMRILQDDEVKRGELEAEKRVVSMCIDAALSEDDFETAYSYIVTRLKDIAGPAHARSYGAAPTKNGIVPDMPPKILDDWSWRAALQAGKYRRSANTLKPTHLGNTNANPEIRHLEQRMECLSQALRLAPKATLQEILNVYRRCEEELESLNKREEEQEDAWDTQGDNTMPGGFGPASAKKGTIGQTTRGSKEVPVSLFDLSRASVKRAQSGFASLATARNTQQIEAPQSPGVRVSGENPRTGTPDSATAPVRKRDQLRNVAVGGLASGVGWLIGAPAVRKSEEEERG